MKVAFTVMLFVADQSRREGGGTHMKGQYGYDWRSRPPFLGSASSSNRPPVAFCSSSEDPSFLKFLIFNQTIDIFFSNFVAPKAHRRTLPPKSKSSAPLPRVENQRRGENCYVVSFCRTG